MNKIFRDDILIICYKAQTIIIWKLFKNEYSAKYNSKSSNSQ